MRVLTLAAGLAACVALAGCEGSKSVAAAPEPEAVAPKKKSLARPRPLYAGQEQILSVEKAELEIDRGALVLKVEGKAPTGGYKDAVFVPRIYAAAPKDGIYEVDVVATKPDGAATPAVTAMEIEKSWDGYPKDRLKGVKFITKTNEVVAMLPGTAAAGGS